MNVPHDALFQNCTYDSTPPNMRVARAPDKKHQGGIMGNIHVKLYEFGPVV